MIREVYPGGTYCDALPGGPRIVSYKDSTAPGGWPLFVRIHPAGGSYAFVSHEGSLKDRAWEWDGTQFIDHGPAEGANAVIYDDAGRLHVNKPGSGHGTQGFRFFDEAGQLWTGDQTYNGKDQYGLAEWTRHGDVTVGQSYVAGDAATTLHDGVRRILEPGHCRFIRFHRVGSQCVVACWKMQENAAVIIWFDVAELAHLPLEQTRTPQPQTPTVPTPPPQGPPSMTPDWSAFYAFLRSKWNDTAKDPAALHRLVGEWHHVHNHTGFGLLHKAGGANHNGFSEDWILERLADGSVWGEDAVVGMGGPDPTISGNAPTPEPHPENWRLPPIPTGGDDGDPGDETDPPPIPPAPDLASLTREMVELRSHIAALIAMNAELQTQINDSDDVMLRLAQQVAALGTRVDGLRFKVDIGKTWGHAHGATVIVEPQA
jgi:hypothetical protein